MKSVPRVALVLAALTLLTGCAAFGQTPSPTTTHTNAAGEQVVAEWMNYPAHAGQDGEALIGYPDQVELQPVATRITKDIAEAITDESGIALVPATPESTWFADDNWHAQVGNGYGGESMLITVNCCELASEGTPDRAKWQSVLDAASRAAERAGLGPFVVDEQSESCGKADRESCWILAATASDGVQWVWFTIQDRALDRSGDAEREAEKFDWPMATIAISYGATVVQAGKQDKFARAMQDFVGLDRPAGTTSD